MKKFICLIILILICSLVVGIYIYAKQTDGLYFTDDIADYNTASSMLPEIFLEEIPETADVVSFSNYSYYNEDEDIYLELKFDSIDAMDAYLEQLKTHSRQASAKYSDRHEWFIEQENPYNSSYVDLFCAWSRTYSGEQNYCGYEIDLVNVEKNQINISCCYSIISFSYDELVVIQTYASGTFKTAVQDYIPKFIQRFDDSIKDGDDYIVSRKTV